MYFSLSITVTRVIFRKRELNQSKTRRSLMFWSFVQSYCNLKWVTGVVQAIESDNVWDFRGLLFLKDKFIEGIFDKQHGVCGAPWINNLHYTFIYHIYHISLHHPNLSVFVITNYTKVTGVRLHFLGVLPSVKCPWILSTGSQVVFLKTFFLKKKIKWDSLHAR